jgi:hypothetical protein
MQKPDKGPVSGNRATDARVLPVPDSAVPLMASGAVQGHQGHGGHRQSVPLRGVTPGHALMARELRPPV